MKAAYEFTDFTSACAIGIEAVHVIRGARVTAESDFNLKTNSEILGFIFNGGLEKPKYIKTKPWENDPKNSGIMVDSYNFYSGNTKGYIAYLYQPETKKWLLKSFKKDNPPGGKNLPFEGLKQMLEGKGGAK